MATEIERITDISFRSRYAAGLNAVSTRYSLSVFEGFLRPGSVLELGPAEGIMTQLLVEKCKDITVIEGAEIFCKSLRERFPLVCVVNSLFEEFTPTRHYDNIILGHVLEHVEDPVKILSKVKGWLSPDGRVFAAVPNARSLHRQAAVIMGLLKNEKELNDNDHYHGHRRVYDQESFRADFIAAGLKVEHLGGYWIKPLSNRQIEESWTKEMIDAFMRLGERYPDIAAELFIVARR